MLNEDKIKTMTQLAVYDVRQRRRDTHVIRTDKKGYVKREIGFIVITMIIFSAYIYYYLFLDRFNKLTGALGHVTAVCVCAVALLAFVMLIFAYIHRIHGIMSENYDRTEKRVTYYLKLLKTIDSIYKEGHLDK